MSGVTIIDVTFVDAEQGTEFLKLKLPLRGLPEVQASMPLGKDTWLVVDRVDDLAKSTCRLFLRKAELVDAHAILFSLPTVADVIPEEVVAGGSLTDALRLHEDDWLQLELMPEGIDVRGELAAIREVLTHQREGAGFKKLHLRRQFQSPFAGRGLRREKLRELFGTERPVAWKSGTAPLKDCFAFTLPDGTSLYGQACEGEVIALGMTARIALPLLPQAVLIDWCFPP